MVKHIILFKLKEGLNNPEQLKKDIKTNLEDLVGKIPGLLKLNVVIDHLDSSNVDILLDSTLVDEEALKVYADHPEHVKVKDSLVMPNVVARIAYDYKIKD